MLLDAEEMEAIGRAIAKAHEAFNDEIGKAGTDPAFYPVTISVRRLSSNFEDVLTTITYEDNA